METSARFDLAQLRADTPGVQNRVHFNNAGAALMPLPVLDAMKGHLDLEGQIGGYEAEHESAAELGGVYDSVATLLGATRDEIALVENATVAWQMAFYSIPFKAGDRILTSEAEYAANYVAFLQVGRRSGAVVEVVPSDDSGELDLDALESMIDDRVKLIAVTWIPTNGGLVNPAAGIGAVAKRHGVLFLLDACQAVGQMPVDVNELNCDMLSATGRKFLRGPRGTGFLFVRGELIAELEPPIIDHFAAPWVQLDQYRLRDDARRFENWENNYAGRLGLGVAVEYALKVGIEVIEERALMLAGRLRDGLVTIPGASLHDLGRRPSSIVSATIAGTEAEDLMRAATSAGFNIGTVQPASTLVDSLKRDLPNLLRVSPHYYNSEDEVDRFLAFLDEQVRAR